MQFNITSLQVTKRCVCVQCVCVCVCVQCVGTHRRTFADEAMWGVTGYSTGPSIATRFSLTSIEHCVTALTCRGAGHKKCCVNSCFKNNCFKNILTFSTVISV